MKTKLLYMLLFISGYAFAQIPTDETMRYLFTSGSLVNEANSGTGDLTQTGSASTQISDVNSVANAALQLNGDTFVGGQTAPANNREITISFWMKSLPPANSTPQVILQLYGDGGRGIRLQQSLHGSGDVLLEWRGKATNNQAKGVLFNPNDLHDNQWHHIAIRTFEYYASSDQAIPVEIYIDGVQNTNFNVGFNDASAYFPPFLSNGVLTIATSGNYQGGIDDVRVYERSLSSTEINQLSKDNNVEIIYVDKNAGGSNDGTSWANAYTDLQNAISNITSTTDQVWIAKGEYTPHASDRNVYFDFSVPNVTVYGSFNGETDPDNRDLKNNRTILSGELTNDGNINNNSYHIVRVTAANIILDGLTIEKGSANASSGFNSNGSAIYKNANVRDITIRNCVIQNNKANAGAVNLAYNSGLTGSNLKIERTRFYQNLAGYGSGLYYSLNVGASLSTEITNCLFDGNESTSYSSSAAWLRATNAGTYNDVKITNCTFTNNNNNGNSYSNTSMRAVLGLSGINTRMPVTVANNIFYNNIDQFHGTGGVAQAISGISSNLNASVTVYNSIDELSFSNISNLNSTLNSDPLFEGTSNYNLLPGSPALDSGNNTFVDASTKDLAGNNRIFNGTVDMGCFEVQTTNTYDLTINTPNGNGSITPNVGTYTYFEGSSIILNANADFGWNFDSWTGDVSGNINPLEVVMNSNQTITPNFTPVPKVFVDMNATGANDGSSWADAFTNIPAALNAGSLEIWVAAGTYKPGSSRSATFGVTADGMHIYGGFSGTETSLNNRDVLANPTILSGDLNGNDNGVDFTLATRSENSYHVMDINADNVVIDGFQINDGHANSSGTNAYGGAILVRNLTENLIIRNCEFNQNVGYTGGAIRSYLNVDTTMTFENCTFYNNLSRYGSGLYFLVNTNKTVSLNVTNCLFSRNRSADQGNNAGYTGSAIWARANTFGSNLTTTITNCTFGGNTDVGSQPNTVNGTLALSRRTDGGSTHNATVNNSIFYFNDVLGGGTGVSVNAGHTSLPNTLFVNNSISEDGFSNISSGNLTNTSSANPLFSDASNFDFTLQSGSPAIDSGDNTKVPSGITADLLFNQRIHNTTVDMGCYEFGAVSTLSNQDFEIENNNLVVYPNPTTSILHIKSNNTISKIFIYDLLGKKVLETQNTTINILGLKSGMYLLKVQNESNTIVKRFIKR